MIKFHLLLCLLLNAMLSFAQKESSHGVLITRTDHHNTSQTLYVSKGINLLSVYTVENNKATEAATYQLKKSGNGFVLYCNNHQSFDTLKFTFQDQAHALIVDNTDRYILFPAFYAKFRKNISIMNILNLLSDGIKEYPVNDALQPQTFTPQTSRHIQKATIVTKRSQADMQDTWNCRYFYNKFNQLDSVSAANREEVRFHKKLHYSGAAVRSETTYLNIESRQVSNAAIFFKSRSLINKRKKVIEIGKNIETISNVTITKLELSPAALLKLMDNND